MNRTRIIALACLVAVAVAVLVVVLVTRNSKANWKYVAVTKVGFANNRSTVWAQTAQYHSGSCFNVRIHVDRDQNPWQVGVQVQQTDADFCTAEAGIGSPPSPATGVVVFSRADPNPRDGVDIPTLDLESPAPTDVTLAIHQAKPGSESDDGN